MSSDQLELSFEEIARSIIAPNPGKVLGSFIMA